MRQPCGTKTPNFTSRAPASDQFSGRSVHARVPHNCHVPKNYFDGQATQRTNYSLVGGGSSGGGPGQAMDGTSGVGAGWGTAGAIADSATAVAGWRSGSKPRQVRNMPSRNPTAIAMKPTAMATRTSPWTGEMLDTRPPASGPVVAVSVCACSQLSFQIAVLRSSENSAPCADVITCGTVSAKVTVNIDASSSPVSMSWDPREGLGCTAGAVLNV